MQIKITGHGLEITGALRDYVQEKTGKLEEFFKNIQKVEVILDARAINDLERNHVAEIRAWMAGKGVIQAREGGRDAYAAFDLALQEARRQIERHKEKIVHEQRRKAVGVKTAVRAAPRVNLETGPVLVRVNRFNSKPMSFEEARDELKNLKQDFLAFRNTKTKEINVVRKNQGDFDLLRPEKELTPSEAMAELERSGREIIIFNNTQSDCPSVVFRRKTGNFGLIEPEL